MDHRSRLGPASSELTRASSISLLPPEVAAFGNDWEIATFDGEIQLRGNTKYNRPFWSPILTHTGVPGNASLTHMFRVCQ